MRKIIIIIFEYIIFIIHIFISHLIRSECNLIFKIKFTNIVKYINRVKNILIIKLCRNAFILPVKVIV